MDIDAQLRTDLTAFESQLKNAFPGLESSPGVVA
jgi:hypothetical protein